MLLGEIVFIALCGLGATGLTIWTAPYWMHWGQDAGRDLRRRVAQAEREFYHPDEENH